MTEPDYSKPDAWRDLAKKFRESSEPVISQFVSQVFDGLNTETPLAADTVHIHVIPDEKKPEKPTVRGTVLNVAEKQRTYKFPGGDEIVIKKPREIIIRDSGTHRVTDADGNLFVINKGWLAILIYNDGKPWDA